MRKSKEQFIAAVRAGCGDTHLRCSYPDCGCPTFPGKILSAIYAYKQAVEASSLPERSEPLKPSPTGKHDE